MEVSVPNLNVLPVCLPLPKKERKKKRQNVVKVVKGKALLLLLVYTYVLRTRLAYFDEYAFLAYIHLQKFDACG